MSNILHSVEEDNLFPFDSNIACLCQSIEINNKYLLRLIATYVNVHTLPTSNPWHQDVGHQHIYMFVVNFDALAQASDIRFERSQVVFLCWMQDSNLEVLDTYSSAGHLIRSVDCDVTGTLWRHQNISHA